MLLLTVVVGRPRVLVAGPVPVPGARDTVEGSRYHGTVGSPERPTFGVVVGTLLLWYIQVEPTRLLSAGGLGPAAALPCSCYSCWSFGLGCLLLLWGGTAYGRKWRNRGIEWGKVGESVRK